VAGYHPEVSGREASQIREQRGRPSPRAWGWRRRTVKGLPATFPPGPRPRLHPSPLATPFAGVFPGPLVPHPFLFFLV